LREKNALFYLECCYLLEGLSDIEYFSALISSPTTVVDQQLHYQQMSNKRDGKCDGAKWCRIKQYDNMLYIYTMNKTGDQVY